MQLVDAFEKKWSDMTDTERERWSTDHPESVGRSAEGLPVLDLQKIPLMCACPREAGLPLAKVRSYDTFLKKLKAWIKRAGKDPEEYGTHSCRRGGTTQLWEYGVEASLVQEAGRWRSAKSMQTYLDWDTAIQQRVKRVREQIRRAEEQATASHSDRTGMISDEGAAERALREMETSRQEIELQKVNVANLVP